MDAHLREPIMSDNDLCVCGHRRDQHVRRWFDCVGWGDEIGRLCECPQFRDVDEVRP
jgi:hypothetical protein